MNPWVTEVFSPYSLAIFHSLPCYAPPLHRSPPPPPLFFPPLRQYREGKLDLPQMGYSTASLAEAIAGLCLENTFGDTDDVAGDLVDARATLREYMKPTARACDPFTVDH